MTSDCVALQASQEVHARHRLRAGGQLPLLGHLLLCRPAAVRAPLLCACDTGRARLRDLSPSRRACLRLSHTSAATRVPDECGGCRTGAGMGALSAGEAHTRQVGRTAGRRRSSRLSSHRHRIVYVQRMCMYMCMYACACSSVNVSAFASRRFRVAMRERLVEQVQNGIRAAATQSRRSRPHGRDLIGRCGKVAARVDPRPNC